MNPRKIISIKFLLLVLSTILIFNTCTKDKTPVPPEPCDPNKVYFQNDIQPLINSSCAKADCHDAISHKEDLNLTTYNGIMKIVKPGNPGGSDIMKVINQTDPNEKIMPPPPDSVNKPLTAEQKAMISKWISEGAYNNSCTQDTANCVVGVVSYSLDISKIMGTNCIGCHSGTNKKGGIDLSNYSGVKTVAVSGKLYNSVAWNGKARNMPENGSKLGSCDIKKIQNWVNAGSPNN